MLSPPGAEDPAALLAWGSRVEQSCSGEGREHVAVSWLRDTAGEGERSACRAAKLLLGQLELVALVLSTGSWCLDCVGSSLWPWITPVASNWSVSWGLCQPGSMALPFLTCCAPAGLSNTPWPRWSCLPMFFHGVNDKYREGAALIVKSLGEFSLTALQQNHPRMVFCGRSGCLWKLAVTRRDHRPYGGRDRERREQ